MIGQDESRSTTPVKGTSRPKTEYRIYSIGEVEAIYHHYAWTKLGYLEPDHPCYNNPPLEEATRQAKEKIEFFVELYVPPGRWEELVPLCMEWLCEIEDWSYSAPNTYLKERTKDYLKRNPLKFRSIDAEWKAP